MAVFTKVSAEDLAAWGQREFCFTQVSPPRPLTSGTENTNYLVQANKQYYIFTIFEFWDLPTVLYYTALTRHLATKGALVPVPLTPANPAGYLWGRKPCLLTPMIIGKPILRPSLDECFAVGSAIGHLHHAAADFTKTMPHPRGEAWRTKALEALSNKICPETFGPAAVKALHQAAQQDKIFSTYALPQGPCHCDLFRDNVLWNKGQITGIIDFYSGGTAELIFDLGVALCDWCFDNAGKFIPAQGTALMAGYRQQRQLLEIEEQNFRIALYMAAFRFWLSRLHDLHFPRPAILLTTRHPRRFEQIYNQIDQLDSALWTKSK